MSRRDDLHPPLASVREVVAACLAEDLMPLGDITASLVPADLRGSARLVARSAGVLAGRLAATAAFDAIDPALECEWDLDDGDPVRPGDVIATVSGALRSLLTAERTALNLLCHLSGVASATRLVVDAVNATNPSCGVRDTRKTTPGLRALEKAAVRAGGGVNHRGSLSESVLVKDNHLGGLSITDAVELARHRWPGRHVEVECDTLDQLREALAVGADMVMLDNMSPHDVARCVTLVAELTAEGGRRVPVEVSGGVTVDSAGAYAAAGADFVSLGAITHSAPVLDIGLDLVAP
jgi:nicotinate-nucleotide pyrophosphorylase (carboxylating)